MLALDWLRHKLTLQNAVALEIVLVLTAVVFFLPGGEDLYRTYLPLSEGIFTLARNPWHTVLIIFPLAFIPARWLWPVWTLASGLMIWWACWRLGTNPALVLLAFPTLAMVWLGQIDALIVLGIALAATAKSPYLRGLGLTLTTVKPQLATAGILVLLWHDRQRWKTLIVPAAVLAISLAIWGLDWPIRWWRSQAVTFDRDLWKTASLFPYGLIAFAALPLLKAPRDQLTLALLASALGIPEYGIYSYVIFLAMVCPTWALPLSYAWALAYPLIQGWSLQFAWTLPLALLAWLIWPSIRAWHQRRKEGAEPPEPPALGPAQE